MSVQSDIYDHAVGGAAVTALIGTRFYSGGRAARDTALPYCVLTRLSGSRVRHLGGASGLNSGRWQIDCIDDNPQDAETLMDAVRIRFESFRGSMGGGSLDVRAVFVEDGPAGLDDATGDSASTYRETLEMTIWHAESTT